MTQNTPGTTATDIDEVAINTIRTLAMDAVQKANSGHPGTPMGLAPLGYVLFTRIMRHNPLDPGWLNRDRFVLSPGHACMLQYSLLHLCGYDVSLEDIKSFRQWGSKCPGHPEYGVTPGVEISTGPLGQGFANGVGFALAEAHHAANFNRGDHTPVDHHTYVICSDGDMEEGIASEAGSLAGNLGLGKLIAIYDDNEISIEGATHLAFHEEVAQRFDAYGWHVHECPHEATLEDIEMAIREAQGVTDRPSFITLPSHIGFGSPNKQDTGSAHGSPLGEEEIKLTKENLGWPYGEPFTVPEEVRELFAGVRERGVAAQATWSEAFEAYAAEHEDLASEFLRVTRRHAPKLPPVGEMPTSRQGAMRSRRGRRRARELARTAGAGAARRRRRPRAVDGDQPRRLPRRAAPRLPAGATSTSGIREHRDGAIVNALTIEGMRAYGATFLVQRLHEGRDPDGGADGDPLDLHLHARLDRGRRGRPDPPADRAPRLAAGDAEPRRDPARRRQRGLPRLALAARRAARYRPRWC